ncbi:hypothetical protein BD769DRAFT_1420719 [Suillus cothurnatus]|nr:hypothetical protein BD769DRAFT_1420719 [Suillus cothurnatus]
MSLDDDTSSASTLTLLDDDAFKTNLLVMMSDTGPETNDQLKRRAKAVLRDMESMLTSVHEVKTYGILDAMVVGAEKAGLSSGVRYAAAAIIVAYQKGEGSNSSASELTKLAQDWLLFFILPRQSKKPTEPPTLHASEVVADTIPATTRRSYFRGLIVKRDNDQCAVTGTLNIHHGPYPPEDKEGYLEAAYILRRSIVHEHCANNRIAGTIDIIKHYTKLPVDNVDDLAGIIDNPENGMLLDMVVHRGFNNYAWCLHPTDVLHKYIVHWFDHVPNLGKGKFTEVQFQDHSQAGISLPTPQVIDEVYDAFSDDGPMVLAGNRDSEEDFRIRLSLIGLTTNTHQLPTNPHQIHAH